MFCVEREKRTGWEDDDEAEIERSLVWEGLAEREKVGGSWGRMAGAGISICGSGWGKTMGRLDSGDEKEA